MAIPYYETEIKTSSIQNDTVALPVSYSSIVSITPYVSAGTEHSNPTVTGIYATGKQIALFHTIPSIRASISEGTTFEGYTYRVSNPPEVYYELTAYSSWLSAVTKNNQSGTNCGIKSISPPATITCAFDTAGGTPIPQSQSGSSPLSVAEPSVPTKAGYRFLGWFSEAIGGTQITFPYTVEFEADYTETLYAQWETVTLAKGGYIFEIPDSSSPIKIFNDTTVATTAFVADTTYADYGYRASIALTDVTADMVADIVFGMTEAISGNYAPIAETYAGGVYIYATAVPDSAITIPTITVMEG